MEKNIFKKIICIYVCVLSCSVVFNSANSWTVAQQAPLSMGFSRKEYWSGLPCPSSGHLPDPRIELTSLTSPASLNGFFTISATWEAPSCCANLGKGFTLLCLSLFICKMNLPPRMADD